MSSPFFPQDDPPIGHAAVDEGISFDVLSSLFRRHRILVCALALLFAATTIVSSLMRARTYTSQATFVTQSTRTASAISGLASQFGVALPSADATQSPQFYVDLVHSHQIVAPVTAIRYRVHTERGPLVQDLAYFYKIHEENPALRRDKVIRALDSHLTASADAKTDVVTLSVSAPYPILAQQITAQILARLNAFNLQGRQSRATAERKFTEGRLAEVGMQLHAAENRLERFLDANRQYRLSPQLSLEQDRLSREVAMRQQVYTSLAQSYEQAKIDEVRDLPVITVITEPEIPVVPDSRGILKKAILALIVGAAVGLGLAYWIERRAPMRDDAVA